MKQNYTWWHKRPFPGTEPVWWSTWGPWILLLWSWWWFSPHQDTFDKGREHLEFWAWEHSRWWEKAACCSLGWCSSLTFQLWVWSEQLLCKISKYIFYTNITIRDNQKNSGINKPQGHLVDLTSINRNLQTLEVTLYWLF